MDFSKIAASVDAERLADSHVLQVGLGGGAQLAMNLARSGVGLFTLIDPDVVSEANLARQQFRHADVGRRKALVVAEAITAINPAAAIQPILLDVCGLPDFVVASLHLTMPDLLLAMTDHFPAQAKVNELSLRFGVPAVFAGLFAGARGGEVAFVVPGETPCFRCLARNRYAAHKAQGLGHRHRPPVRRDDGLRRRLDRRRRGAPGPGAPHAGGPEPPRAARRHARRPELHPPEGRPGRPLARPGRGPGGA